MIFAVIATGGKQYKVEKGSVLRVEKLDGFSGVKDGKITFSEVLLTDNGEKTAIGTPYIFDAKVTASVLHDGCRKKVTVVKYQPKSRYYKKRGHRQPYTEVRIDSIT